LKNLLDRSPADAEGFSQGLAVGAGFVLKANRRPLF
jgi:hypothetical protein